MSFTESDPDRSPGDAPVEDYSMESVAGLVVRSILRRDGSVAVSVVADTAPRTPDLRDRYDLSWLRSRCAPPSGSGEPLNIVDLFAGCGGLSLGVAEACRALDRRVAHVLAVELEDNAAEVFEKNFAGTDVRTQPIEEIVNGEVGRALTWRERKLRTSLPDVDLMLAGPPCQGHSDLNNHSRRNDPKNALYLRAVRFAEVIRPRVVLIENVPGVAHDQLGVVQRAVARLTELQYSVRTSVVSAEEFGVPQRRRRHVLVASANGALESDEVRLLRSRERPVTWAIDDLGVSPSRDVFDSPARHATVNEQRIRYLFEHDIYDLPDAQRPDCHRLKPHSYRAVYGRMFADRPAPTITAGFGSTGQGRFVHPFEPRTLTPHEAARVQGFPDFFDFSPCRGRRALQQMIGNAVPPRLAYALAVTLLR
jgi:DNA (cytosine-5)-methyltransferase 1